MTTVLVSGASGIVGYGILRSLRRCGRPLALVGTSIYTDSIAPAFCDIFECAPHTGDAAYVEWLLRTVAKHRVDLIIPGIEIDMYTWAEHAEALEAAGITALLNNVELVELCRDKWVFYEALKASDVRCMIDSSLDTDFDVLEARFGLPFLLKPRRGFASKGIVRISDIDAFLEHRQKVGPILMAQPIVGSDDREFTTAVFCDGRGDFSSLMTLRRKLSADGFTEKAEVVPSDEFIGTIRELCRRLLPNGPTNFQFRVCDHEVKLLEINPRISSSTAIRTAFGYNESAMAVEYYLEHRMPDQPAIRRGRAIRYTEEHIFYEDGIHL